MEAVAEEKFSCSFPDGRTSALRIRVGRPRPRATGEWACAVQLEGLPGWEVSHDIFGEGPLQALTLGLRFLRRVLLDAAAGGVVLRCPVSKEIVSVAQVFGTEQGE